MNKIVFLAVCCALFGIMSPTRAEQQLHLQMFPEVKLNDINDPANFDESWNGETMICFSKGRLIRISMRRDSRWELMNGNFLCLWQVYSHLKGKLHCRFIPMCYILHRFLFLRGKNGS